MKRPPLAAWALSLAVLVLAVPAAEAGDASTRESAAGSASGGTYAWLEGAAGFAEALEVALAEEEPLAVYFYTDWCGYCRQLERELLYRAEVEDYLRQLTKVRINPEKGRQEQAVAHRYGVNSYPRLFIHPGPGHEAELVSGRVKRNGEWQMQTPKEFVETLRELVAKAE